MHMALGRKGRTDHNLVRFLAVRSSSSPTFSYDDKSLVYISDATGTPQVWSIRLEEGSAPQQLTYYEDRVGFVSSARKRDSFVFAKDRRGDERFQLFAAANRAADLTQLTDSPDVIHDFGAWSPDEGSILLSSNARDRAFFDVYTLNLSTRRMKRVHQSNHTNRGIDWSPDGRSILFRRDHAPFNHDLFLIGTDGIGARLLTEHKGDAVFTHAQFGREGGEIYLITDLGRKYAAPAILETNRPEAQFLIGGKWDVDGLSLSEDGRRLAFTKNVDGASRLMVWELAGSPTTVGTPRGVISGLSWSKKGDMLAFAFSSAKYNQDIWIHDLRDGSLRRVTNSSASGLNLRGFSQPGLFRYRSFDGLPVSSYLYDGNHRRRAPPALVYIHGGPESQFRPGFNPVVQFLTSIGFSVVAPNVRGSTGYGRTYTHLDDVRRRMDSVRDIERLVKHLKKKGRIGNSVGVMGGSYGGFMVLACLYRYPKIWAAGVDVVGISNFLTFLRNTGPWRRKLRAAEYGDPDRDKDFLERISPLNNAARIKAPLFMIHGTNDPRVPFRETKQIEAKLKKLGREVRVMAFDDEGHGLVKLKNRIVGYTAAAEFLSEHLTQR